MKRILLILCAMLLYPTYAFAEDNNDENNTVDEVNSYQIAGFSDIQIKELIEANAADIIPLNELEKYYSKYGINKSSQVNNNVKNIYIDSSIESKIGTVNTSVSNNYLDTQPVEQQNLSQPSINTQTINNNPLSSDDDYEYSYPNYTPPIENQNLPQPPLTTQSSNEANQLNDNQNLTTNPPFTSVTKVNTGQAERNKDTQNTSSQQANLSEKNDTVEKVAESEIEKELSQELPSVKENTQSTQEKSTDNQQGGTQNPKSEEVIEDKTFQEE